MADIAVSRPLVAGASPVVLIAVALQLAIAAVYLVPGVPDGLRSSLIDLATLPLLVGWSLVAVALRALRTPRGTERDFWILFGLGLGAYFTVRVLFLFILNEPIPAGSVLPLTTLFSEPIYLGFYLLAILAIRLQPDHPMLVRKDPTLAWAERASIYLFAFTFLVYFTAIPAYLAPAEVESGGATQLQYALLDAILCSGFVFAAVRARTRGWRVRYLWLAGATALFFVTDLFDGIYYLSAGADGRIPAWADHLYYLPFLFFVLAAEVDSGTSSLPAPHPKDSTGRALTALVLFALVLPSVHFGFYWANFLAPEIRDERGVVVLVALFGLMVLAWRYQQKVVQLLGTAESRSELAEHERTLLAAAVEQSEERIAIVGPQMGIEYVNEAFADDVGESRGALRDRSLFDFIRTVDPAQDPRRDLAEGRSWVGRCMHRRAGVTEEENVSITPVHTGDGRPLRYVAVRRDLSVDARLEQQLRQSQKMESLGTLAGGVAHDFNNILSAIYGYLDLSLQSLATDHPARADLAAVFRATDRAKELVDQILRLSRRADVAWRNVDLTAVLTEVEELVRAGSPSSVTLNFELDPALPAVRGSSSQLHQVVLNLVTNAVQAAGRDGTVRVRAERVGSESGADEVVIRVRDDGPGVAPEIAARIFDPFFTTKDVGEGTGLGLSVAHGIVASHSGSLTLSPGGDEPGAEFVVRLPASEIEDQDDPTRVVETRRGSGKILIVEDETDLRTLLRRRLVNAGYSCEGFDSPPALLDALEAGAQADLIVTDQTMPRMTGTELVAELRARGIDTPIILISGFATGIDPEELARLSIGSLLPKPFRAETLLLEIERLLPAGE